VISHITYRVSLIARHWGFHLELERETDNLRVMQVYAKGLDASVDSMIDYFYFFLID